MQLTISAISLFVVNPLLRLADMLLFLYLLYLCRVLCIANSLCTLTILFFIFAHVVFKNK
jgi:hypothetical protein